MFSHSLVLGVHVGSFLVSSIMDTESSLTVGLDGLLFISPIESCSQEPSNKDSACIAEEASTKDSF